MSEMRDDAAEYVPGFQPVEMTYDEYLAFDEASPQRFEYVDGVVYAMTGASTQHNLIEMNLVAMLHAPAKRAGCRLYSEGVKLRLGDDIYCPDLMVICDKGGDDERMAYRPCLIVEVLSPSTERHDRGEKLARYRRTPTLRTYLLVSQHERRVVRHWRDEGGPWQYADHVAGERFDIACPVAMSVAVDDLYDGLDVPAPTVRRVREEATAGG